MATFYSLGAILAKKMFQHVSKLTRLKSWTFLIAGTLLIAATLAPIVALLFLPTVRTYMMQTAGNFGWILPLVTSLLVIYPTYPGIYFVHAALRIRRDGGLLEVAGVEAGRV